MYFSETIRNECDLHTNKVVKESSREHYIRTGNSSQRNIFEL